MIDTDAVSIAMTKAGIRPQDAARVLDILEGCTHDMTVMKAWDGESGTGTIQCTTCGDLAHFSLDYQAQEWHDKKVCG